MIPRMFSHKMQLNEKFFIKTEMLTVDNRNGGYEVPIPMSHIGQKSIQCSLMSKTMRNGMVKFYFYL
jgi:Hormone-sensitive lipase (HSL) N-terminus